MDLGVFIILLTILFNLVYFFNKSQNKDETENADREEEGLENPFDEMFGNLNQSGPLPKQKEEAAPHEAQQPTPTNYEDDLREAFQAKSTSNTEGRAQNTAGGQHQKAYHDQQAYGRPGGQPYDRPASQAYERKQKKAYSDQHKNAYRRPGKQKRKRSNIQQHLKGFDPMMAVIYSDILNRPKYLEDQPPGPFDRDAF